VGVCALTLLLGIELALSKRVTGSLLGNFAAGQVQGVDFLAAALAVGLGAASVADVLVPQPEGALGRGGRAAGDGVAAAAPDPPGSDRGHRDRVLVAFCSLPSKPLRWRVEGCRAKSTVPTRGESRVTTTIGVDLGALTCLLAAGRLSDA
jgi:hypothetical protein